MKLLETSGQFSKPWEGWRLWAKSHDRTSSVKAQLSQPLEPGCGSFSIRMEPPRLCFVVSLATNPKSRNRCINWQSLGHVPLPTFKRSWEIKDPEFHLCTMGDFAQIGRSSGAGKRKKLQMSTTGLFQTCSYVGTSVCQCVFVVERKHRTCGNFWNEYYIQKIGYARLFLAYSLHHSCPSMACPTSQSLDPCKPQTSGPLGRSSQQEELIGS